LAEVVRYDSDGKRNRYWLKHPREIRRRSRLAFPFREGRFSDGRARPLAAVSFPGFWNSGNLHAEIYPSVRAPLKDTIKDRGQVRAMWHWARDLDGRNLLMKEFALPPGIGSGSAEDHLIRSEEGWILGCSG
jgi:hypothetical protein